MDAVSRASYAPRPSTGVRRWVRPALGVLGYLVLAWFVARSVDLREVRRSVATLGATGASAVLGLSLIHIAARAKRFDWLVRRAGPGPSYHLGTGFHVFLVGLSASAVTPGRIGDLVKAQLLSPHGVPLPVGVALVLLERALDLAVVALFMVVLGAALGAGLSFATGGLIVLAVLAIGAAAAVGLLRSRTARAGLARGLDRLAGPSRAARVSATLGEVLSTGRRVFPGIAVLSGALGASALAWSVEFLKLWVALRFLGASVSPAVILFAYPASILAGVVALVPVSEGVVGLTGAALLVAVGHVDPALAAAAVIVDRAASTLPPLLLWLGSSAARGLVPRPTPS